MGFFRWRRFPSESKYSQVIPGIALTDRDRLPWLTRLHDLIAERLGSGQPAILACSALKKSYRDLLLQANPGTTIVYLRGETDLIMGRLQARHNHFMNNDLLESQFEILEEPVDSLTLDISTDVDTIALKIIQSLNIV